MKKALLNQKWKTRSILLAAAIFTTAELTNQSIAVAGGGTWNNSTNADNVWSTATNWSTGDQPTSSDNANFNLANTYNVLFAADATAFRLAFNAGNVSFDLGGYALTLDNQLDILNVQSATATITNGSVAAPAGMARIGGGRYIAGAIDQATIGTLTLTSGGQFSCFSNANIGIEGGKGIASVNGPSSILSSTAAGVVVGSGRYVSGEIDEASDGTLSITNGGQAISYENSYVGYNGGKGAVTVDGADSKLATNIGSMFIGYYRYNSGSTTHAGNGTLALTNGGQAISSAAAFIGSSGGDGTVTVDGIGSKFESTNGTLIVGYQRLEAGSTTYAGDGTLAVTSGGLATGYSTSYVGYLGGKGVVSVDGAGSKFEASRGSLFIGYSLYDTGSTGIVSDGTLHLTSGGQASGGWEPEGYADVVIGLWGGKGLVTVDGADSKLTTSSGSLDVGSGRYFNETVNQASDGTLAITNGGLASGDEIRIGHYGGKGTVTVAGANSQLTSLDITVGIERYQATSSTTINEPGDGTLGLSDGGKAISNRSILIGSGGGKGAVTVDGANSKIESTGGNFIVGYSRYATASESWASEGALTLTNGGQATSSPDGIEVGTAGGKGVATVDGVGSKLESTNNVLNVGTSRFVSGTINEASDGTISITNGGVARGVDNSIGTNGGKGVVTVDGAGSQFQATAGGMSVGLGGDFAGSTNYASNGTLAISNGGLARSNTEIFVGSGGGKGVATVDGVGSKLESIMSYLSVGSGRYVSGAISEASDGTLSITNGGSVSSHLDVSIGIDGGKGVATVAGPSSHLQSNHTNLFVGSGRVFNGAANYAGDGSLAIINGGTVSGPVAWVGSGGGTGVVTVDGAGSRLETVIYVGNGYIVSGSDVFAGEGTLHLTNGGVATSFEAHIGYYGKGTATVDGPSSKLLNTNGVVEVGYGGALFPSGRYTGDGTLNLTNGGKSESNVFYVGLAGGKGVVTVDGTGSELKVGSSALEVGEGISANGLYESSDGTLLVQNGGQANSANSAYIGSGGGKGSTTVTGANSKLTATETLFVGHARFYNTIVDLPGDGTLNISDGGEASTGSAVYVGYYESKGIVNVGKPDGADAGGSKLSTPDLRINFSSGSSNSYTDVGGTLNVYAGGTVDVSGAIDVHDIADASRRVNLAGGTINTGSLALGSAPRLNWTSGTLKLGGGAITGLGSTALVVPAEGTFAGTGTVDGDLDVAGQISPGDSVGAINVSGNYSQEYSGVMLIDVAGTSPGTSHDQVSATGAANLGGTLNVSLASGYAPPIGSVLTIVQAASVAGSFRNLPEGGTTELDGHLFQVGYNDVGGTVNLTRLADPTTVNASGSNETWSATAGGNTQVSTNVVLNATSTYTITVAENSTANKLEVTSGSPTLHLGTHQLELNQKLVVGTTAAQPVTLNIPSGVLVAKTGISVASNAIINAGAGAALQTSDAFVVGTGADIAGGNVDQAPTKITASDVVVNGQISNENVEVNAESLTLGEGATLGGVLVPIKEKSFVPGRRIYSYDANDNPVLQPNAASTSSESLEGSQQQLSFFSFLKKFFFKAPPLTTSSRRVSNDITIPGTLAIGNDAEVVVKSGAKTSGLIKISAPAGLAVSGPLQKAVPPPRAAVKPGGKMGGNNDLQIPGGLAIYPRSSLTGPFISADEEAVDPNSLGWVVDIADGGTIAPGDGPGTISIDGSLVLHDTSILEYELSTPGVMGSEVNDLVALSNINDLNDCGNLTLDGILQVEAEPGFGVGDYTLFTYAGTLQDNALDLNAANLPDEFSYSLDTSTPGSVKLLVGQLVRTWTSDTDETWATGSNWSHSAPNGIGHIANFASAITQDRTITIDGPITVGTMNFDNAHSYTLAGAGPLSLNAGALAAQINVIAGNHTIATPVAFDSNTIVTVTPPGSTLTIAGDLTGIGGLTKSGEGRLDIKNVRTASLSVSQGTIKILPNASAAGTSKIGLLTIGGGAKLDLTDNKLITANAVGTQTGGIYNGVQGYVQSANNPGGGGQWDGTTGITTTQPDATTGLTTIGVSTGALTRSLGPTDTDTWAGQTINGNSTMVMYTYAGDANLDGFIDGTDYFYIDSNVGTSADGYGNGDFNYDGAIDGTDYFFIDSNISAQGAPFFASGGVDTGGELLTGVSAVPEPASLSVIGLAAVVLIGRRRRGAT